MIPDRRKADGAVLKAPTGAGRDGLYRGSPMSVRVPRRDWSLRAGLSLALAAALGLTSSRAMAAKGDIRASDELVVKVVSSAPDRISGGDARLHIDVPRTVPLHQGHECGGRLYRLVRGQGQ